MARNRRKTPRPIELPSEDELPIIHDNTELRFDEEEVKASGKKGVGAVVVHHTVTFLQVVMVLALGTWSYMSFRDTNFLVETSERERSALQPHVIEGQMERIHFALSVYYALNEKYPPTLDVLVNEGLLDQTDPSYPRRTPFYEYQRFGDGYRLFVPSSDGAQESDDALIFEEN